MQLKNLRDIQLFCKPVVDACIQAVEVEKRALDCLEHQSHPTPTEFTKCTSESSDTDSVLLTKQLKSFKDFLVNEYGDDFQGSFAKLSGGKTQLTKPQFIRQSQVAGFSGNVDLVFERLDRVGSGMISAEEFQALRVLSDAGFTPHHEDATSKARSVCTVLDEFRIDEKSALLDMPELDGHHRRHSSPHDHHDSNHCSRARHGSYVKVSSNLSEGLEWC